MGFFQGLTVPAKKVLAFASDEAFAMSAEAVEGPHLLLGFLGVRDTAAHRLLVSRLPDRSAAVAEVARATLHRDGATRPGFGEETALILAAAQGISIGRRFSSVGTAACLLGLLTVGSERTLDILRAMDVDSVELATAAEEAMTEEEPMVAVQDDARPWAVTVDSTAWAERGWGQ